MIKIILKTLHRFDRYIAKAEVGVLLFCLLSVVLINVLEFILRGISGGKLDFIISNLSEHVSPITWAMPLTKQMIVFICFLGASLAAQSNRHLRIDVLTQIIPKKIKPFLAITIFLFCTFVCLLLIGASYMQIEVIWSDHEYVGPINLLLDEIPPIHVRYFMFVIPFAFGMMAFRYLLLTIIEIVRLVGRTKDLPEAWQQKTDTPAH